MLEKVGRNFEIKDNDALLSVSGFDMLDSVGRSFLIGNSALMSISGFEALETVENNFRIFDNTELTSLPDVAMLERVEGNLEIRNNDALASISSFGSLIRVGRRLSIRDNAVLESLSGFEVLRSIGQTIVGTGATDFPISITFNPTLSRCCGVAAFAQEELSANYTLGGNGLLFIGGNAEGCNSADQVRGLGSSCFLTVSTNPVNLIGLPKEAGTISVRLTFLRGITGWEAASLEGGFVSVPASGSSTSITINYMENTTAALRIDTVSITPRGSVSNVPPFRLRILQLGTAAAIVGDVLIDSTKAITEEIRAAKHIVGNLTIGDRSIGTDLTSANLQSLSVEAITGDLRIDSTSMTELTDVFNSLTRVEGDLEIKSNGALRSVSGFAALDTVNSLHINDNAELRSLPDFAVLLTISSALGINNNDVLESLPDFAMLSSVGGYLDIRLNDALESLSGFAALTKGGTLRIEHNDALRSLSGFAALETVSNSFLITENDSLRSLSGFAALETVSNSFFITENDSLRSVSGFDMLGSIGSALRITNNLELRSIPDFPALRNIGIASDARGFPIVITDNPRLSTCCMVFPFAQERLPDGYTLGAIRQLRITNNAGRCSSLEQAKTPTPSCFLTVSTDPDNLIGLPKEEGTIRASLTFLRGTTGVVVRSSEGGFLTVPSSGSSTSLTISYTENMDAAPRTDTLVIRPTGSMFDVPSLRLLTIQQGTAATIVGDLVLDSVEAITEEIRAARHILGSLIIGDGDAGEDLDNDDLADLSVETITEDLIIDRTTTLTELNAFNSLRSVGGWLRIGGRSRGNFNRMLQSVSGFGALETIGGDLLISNDALTTINTFGMLETVGGELVIFSNQVLESFPEFPALRNVGGRLSIFNNSVLESVSGFASLESVGGNIRIVNNNALTSLPDFLELRSIGRELNTDVPPIAITGNSRLSRCCVFFPFVQDSPSPDYILGGNGVASIENNASGCNSVVEIRNGGMCPHRLSVSTTTPGVTVSALSGTTIPISLASDGTTAALRIDLGSGARRWTATEASASFISIAPASGGDEETLTITYSANTATSSRTAMVTLSTEGATGTSITRTLELTQAAPSHTVVVGTSTTGVTIGALSGTTIPIKLPSDGTTAALRIDVGNGATRWNATEAPSSDFISIAPASGGDEETLTITYSANTATSSRTAMITLSTEGVINTSITRTLELTQASLTIVGDVELDSLEAITDEIRAATRIEGNLIIGDGEDGRDITNAELARLQLQTITGNLRIQGTKLIELDAFASLRSVGGGLLVERNAVLRSLLGFGSLTSVGDGLAIRNNAVLESVSGFDMIESVEGELAIVDNSVLRSLPSFLALRNIGGALDRHDSPISIIGNRMLSTCCAILPFVQGRLPGSYTLGGNGGGDIFSNAEGCNSVDQAKALTPRCFLITSTAPSNLIGLSAAEGTIMASLTFLRGTTGWEASSVEGGFVSVPSSGSSTLLRISYMANTAAAPRTDTVSIRPTGSMFDVLSLKLPILQLGTAATIVGDLVLDSVEAITSEIREAQYILGDLVIGDGDAGENIMNNHLARLQVQTITGDLTINRTTLTELNAFSSLTSIGGNLNIGEGSASSDGNGVLSSISGFDVLRTIEGRLYINRNNSLTNITAFGMLRSVGGQLRITSNASLGSLPTFPVLRNIGSALESLTTPIIISFNDMLSACCGLLPFVEESLPDDYTLGGNGMATIGDNTTGCDNVGELRTAAACLHTISVSTTTEGVTVNALTGMSIPISLPANGTTAALTIEVGGAATGFTAMEAEDAEDFVSAVTASDNTLTITYIENPATRARMATITLSTTGPGTAITRRLSLTQAAAPSAHTIMVSTMTAGVVVGTDDGSTIPISLAADATTAALTIEVGGAATGFTAMEAEDAEDFVSAVTTSDDTLTITYIENPATRARMATITLSTTGPGTTISRTLSLTQAAAPSAHTIMVSTMTAGVVVGTDDGSTIPISLPANGTTAALTIEVGGAATGFTAMEAEDSEDFVSVVTTSDNTLTITYSENPATMPRMATITLSTTGPGTTISRTLSLTQAMALAPTLGVSRGEGELVLYPNPVSGHLHLRGLQSSALVRISTLGGGIARRAFVSASASSIDVSDLHKGTYVVVIESSEAVLSRRLVIIE